MIEMYTKEKKYTLEELIEIFCKERESLREMFKKATCLFEVCDYFFDKWIEAARKCKTEEDFDLLLRESLRMSFDDWFSSL